MRKVQGNSQDRTLKKIKAGDNQMIRGYLYKKFFSRRKKAAAPSNRVSRMLEIKKDVAEGTNKFVIIPAKRFITLPSVEELKTKPVIYPLIKPYAYAMIRWDNTESTVVYNIIEPALTPNELLILDKLKEGLMQIINVSLESIGSEVKLINFLESQINILVEQYGYVLSRQEYMKIMYYIYRDFVGLNEIEAVMKDPYIEDIGLDGLNIPIYIVHQKYGSMKTNMIYHDDKKLRQFVTKLAERADRYISYAEPLLDGTLPDGSRVQASIASDVTTRGATFSIRKFREIPYSPVELIANFNTASPEMMAYLWFVVEHGANILIAGGVATGKTSMLNGISLFIPPESKIVSIEDTRELSLPHENWIPGVSRAGFSGSGTGEVSMFELLKESFRQNPDYLIVGEIRGREAYVLFQAMASGHPSMSTIHAGSVDDVMKRLQTRPINLSPGLMESLDLVLIMVHAREKGKSSRRVKEIVEIESIDIDTGKARTSKAFVWLPSVDTFEYRGSSWLLNKISTQKGMQMSEILKDISKRKKFINWLIENNIHDINEINRHVSTYYRSPQSIDKVIAHSGETDEESA